VRRQAQAAAGAPPLGPAAPGAHLPECKRVAVAVLLLLRQAAALGLLGLCRVTRALGGEQALPMRYTP